MCGRYTLTKPIKNIKSHFNIQQTQFDFKPRYNIAPTQNLPVVLNQNENVQLVEMSWGLIPNWAKDSKRASNLINARAETVHEKPSFRDAFKSKRCLVPADGFIEWKAGGKDKQAYYIFQKSKELFAFAGIWSQWSNANQTILTYSIITTEANERLQSIHHRMPVILSVDDYQLWLKQDSSIGDLRSLLKPCPEDLLDTHLLSNTVNNARNDRPECLEPFIIDPLFQQE